MRWLFVLLLAPACMGQVSFGKSKTSTSSKSASPNLRFGGAAADTDTRLGLLATGQGQNPVTGNRGPGFNQNPGGQFVPGVNPGDVFGSGIPPSSPGGLPSNVGGQLGLPPHSGGQFGQGGHGQFGQGGHQGQFGQGGHQGQFGQGGHQGQFGQGGHNQGQFGQGGQFGNQGQFGHGGHNQGQHGREYQLCHNGARCCCVDQYQCNNAQVPGGGGGHGGSDGSGLIDLRIVNRPGQTCKRGEVYCCNEHGGGGHGGGGHGGGGHGGIGQCGVQNPLYSLNEYGKADYGEYPWQALLLDKGDGFVGSGVIIDPTTILTAGHKVYKYSHQDIKVRVGDWDVTDYVPKYETYKSIEYDVQKIIVHPGLNVKNAYNDLAILKLRTPILYNPTVNSICLPDRGQTFSSTPHQQNRCWVTGWGKDAFGPSGAHSPILKEVDVTIHDTQTCNYMFNTFTDLGKYNYKFDGYQFICAGGEAGKDACVGDGGGPLVCNYGGRWTLAGIVAWGKGCAKANVPGAYVNVASFLDWIHQYSGHRRRRG